MNNSLVDEIDSASIIGEIIALRAYAQKSILLVEGPGDLSFFSAFADHRACDIVVAYGRHFVLEVIHKIAEIHEGVLAVIDQDLDAMFEEPPINDNIIVTDDTDIEIMMIRSSAFESVMWELGSFQKIKSLLAAGAEPRPLILKAARRVFLLKFISRRDNLGLKFRDLRLSFVDGDLIYNTRDMVTAVLNHSKTPGRNVHDLVTKVDSMTNSDIDPWAISSGHILCGFIGKALQRHIGTLNSKSAGAEEIESRLRSAFSEWHLKATALFTNIRKWESRNIPYKIFRPEL